MKKKVFVFIFLVFFSWHGALPGASRTIHFKRISIHEGLSQNTIFSMMQDSKGFMWFGTQDGLNKYDGYNFTVYKLDPDDNNSLSHNTIQAICEDNSGKIWVGTNGGGLNCFDPKKEKFTRFPVINNDTNNINHVFVNSLCVDGNGTLWIGTVGGGLSKLTREIDPQNPALLKDKIFTYRNIPGEPDSLSDDFILAVTADPAGNIWVGTGGAGLDKFDPGSGNFTHFRSIPGNPRTLSHNQVNAICLDNSGLLWVGTVGGLNLLDKKTGEFTRYLDRPGDPGSLSDNAVSSVIEDRSGVLWVGTFTGGLNKFNKRSETFTHYRSIAKDPFSLSYDTIISLYEDRSRILWIGTGGKGLNKFDREDIFTHYRQDPDNPNSLGDNFVYSLCEDSSGVLWIGTSDNGLDKFDRGKDTFTHYRPIAGDPRSLNNIRVRCIFEDSAGVLWIGTDGGGLNRFNRESDTFSHFRRDPEDPTSLSNDAIRTIFEDSSGVLWVGTFAGGFNKFDREKETFTRYMRRTGGENRYSPSGNSIYVIYEAPTQPGILWIGTRNGGLNRFDPQSGEFSRYRFNPENPHSLSSDQLVSIHEDSSGMLWIGTYGGGLNKMVGGRKEGEEVKFIHYTEKHGLCNNSVYGILEDGDGSLWLSTNKGLSMFNPQTEIFKNYNVEDGVQGSEFNAGAYFKSKSGEMFFGGLNGFNAFFPRYIDDNPHIPPVVITGFKIADEPVEISPSSPLTRSITWMEELRLSYEQNNISFEFSALDFTIPGKNRYAYKMEGFNDDWIYTGADKRFAYFTNLDPGPYVFRVKGTNNDGVWNDTGTAVRIFISPPFWATWQFRIVLLILCAGLVLLWYRKRLKHVRIKAELQTAHNAQMSIMPQADPEIPGFDVSGICIPANEVGGDFFDYAWMDEEKTKFSIAVGDVSGKAMKSAMTAVMASGMISLKIDETLPVKEILQRINRALYFKTDRKEFVALCLTAIDTQTKEMVFTNAGLTAPLLKSAGRVITLEGAGKKLPLGVKPDSRYLEKKQQLKAGDILFLFTDGVTEARNTVKEYYGQERLRAFLSRLETQELTARRIRKKITADVAVFSGAAAQHDDIAVVVVKVL
ncbi:MAG: SpoIIE family protein phosphatase [Candidatus Aminicenantes bacterium]|nr:SpoIIE family protein phosphatase [Candidatus Aminicenantes bacterium]